MSVTNHSLVLHIKADIHTLNEDTSITSDNVSAHFNHTAALVIFDICQFNTMEYW